jgi:hypothetical protein
VVDATNGNTYLTRVEATLGASRVLASGAVTTEPGVRGHLIVLALTVTGGHMEDFLKLALPAPRPLLTGSLTLSADLRLPPGAERVMDKLDLTHGRFTVTDAHFTNPDIQSKLEAFSRHGLGKKNGEPLSPIHTTLRASFVLDQAVLALSDLLVGVPGATVNLAGSYAVRGGGSRSCCRWPTRCSATTHRALGWPFTSPARRRIRNSAWSGVGPCGASSRGAGPYLRFTVTDRTLDCCPDRLRTDRS